MKTRWIYNIILLLIAVLIGFGLCEIAARLLTSTNADGQAYYGKRPLLPYRFPARMVQKKMEHYFNRQSEAYVVDHPLLGWTIGPNRTNLEGMYRSNSAGIRSRPNPYSLKPPEGVLRIALFGDSFTHGDEEPFYETWGKFLEDDLNRAGISAEVLNFGVPGYGIGQAYLRWKVQGKKYSPRIAVFGFQPENIKRTVNIFRTLYSRDTWLVFSKPRFHLKEDGELELINSPVIPPPKVADLLANLHQSPLGEYEYWYNPDHYRKNFWLKSRFIAFLYTILNDYLPHPGGRYDHRPGKHYWHPRGEPMRTSLAILKKFAREAEAAGEIPIILHIPKRNDLQVLENENRPAHYRVLEELEAEEVLVVDPAPEMTGKSRLYKHSHFSSRGGKIVARVLADAIIRLLEGKNRKDDFQGSVSSRVRRDPAAILLEKYRDHGDLTINLGTAGDRLFIAGGFHHREKHLYRTPVRWTAETAAIRIPVFSRNGAEPVITFRIADTGPERDRVGTAIVERNGKRLGETELKSGENIYRIGLEERIEGPAIVRLILTSPPWQPSRRLGVKDSRKLGVMLDWVQVKYLQRKTSLRTDK